MRSCFQLSVALCLALAAVATAAHSRPRATLDVDNFSDLAKGWTPKPTQAPLRRRLAAISRNELFARQGVNAQTCGFFNNDIASPLVCPYNLECFYQLQVHPFYWDCCTFSGSEAISSLCPPASVCLDNGQSGNNGATSKYTSGGAVLW